MLCDIHALDTFIVVSPYIASSASYELYVGLYIDSTRTVGLAYCGSQITIWIFSATGPESGCCYNEPSVRENIHRSDIHIIHPAVDRVVEILRSIESNAAIG
jgi:hypothetical protein